MTERHRPAGEEEAAELLRQATGEGVRVRLEGRGSRSRPSPPADDADRVISAEALRGVESYEPADLVMTVGAGTPLGEVQEAVAGEGQWLALDPPGGEGRSVGGAVAGGEYGPLHAGMGLPREQVLAARLATGDGRRLRLGAPVVKNVAGFDLLKLVPGSRGRLGLATAVTLRLHPRPPSDRTLVFEAPGPEEGARMARRLMEVPVPVVAFELLAGCPAAGGRPAAVAIRVTGRELSLDAVQSRLEGAVGEAAGEVLADEASRGFFREVARAEAEEEAPLRVAFLPAELPRVVRAVREAGLAWDGSDGSPGPPLRAHVLGGRLRVGTGADPAALAAALAGHAGVGGRPQGGHGTGAPAEPEGGAELVERIRAVFDPGGVLEDGGTPWKEVAS